MSDGLRAPAAWYPDPTTRHEQRFWDGERWTIHVTDGGVPAIDDRVHTSSMQQVDAAHDLTHHQESPGVEQTPHQPTEDAVQPLAVSTKSRRARAWIIAVVVVAVCAAGFAVARFAFVETDGSVHHYPAAVEANFTRGCTANGGSRDSCRCALTRIEKDYDLAAFIAAERKYAATGVLPDKMTAAAVDCAAKETQDKFDKAGAKLSQAGS